MNIRQWEEEVKIMKKEDRELMYNAIKTLEKWEAFSNEFAGTGIFTIAAILKLV